MIDKLPSLQELGAKGYWLHTRVGGFQFEVTFEVPSKWERFWKRLDASYWYPY